MTPKRGDLDNAELFDARGRLIVPKAILATLDAVRDLQRKAEADYQAIQGLACKQTPSLTCTQQVALPGAQDSTDAAIGGAVRWTLGKAWGALPHARRCWLVVVACLTAGGGIWAAISSYIKAALLLLAAHL